MAKAHVIDYKDSSGQALKLDINNGYVYDAAGNQVTKMSIMDRSQDQARATLLSDYCNEFSAVGRSLAASNGDHVRAKDIFASSRERSVLMDLGTGDVHQAAALPNYAAGYANAPPMADVASAPLMVNKPSDKYYTFAKEDAFQLANPSVGAPAGSVPEIAPRLSNATFTTVEYALGGFVSTQIESAADAPLKIRQATARRIMQALMLAREIRVATMLQTSANWNSANVRDLSGSAASKWNGGGSSDPVADIHAALEASWGECSGLVMAQPLYNAFVRNPAVRAYYAYKNAAGPVPTPAEISALLQIPPIFVAKMQYMTSSTAKSYIWGNDVVLFRAPPSSPPQTQDDVATSYTFRWNQSGNSVDGNVASGGFLVREFFNQMRGSQGGNQLVVLHQDVETMTSTYVGGLIKGAYQ